MALFEQRLIGDWKFRRCDESQGEAWQEVFLPHSPFVADLDGQDHWHGRCEYERIIRVENPCPKYRYVLRFEAAMHTAVVLIDGKEAGRHEGGYLPFEIDVTRWVRDGLEHAVLVSLENGDNADIPPGKPFEALDFCYYGGLYRPVSLKAYPSVHFTDPVVEGAVASGGVFVRTVAIDGRGAELAITAHVRSEAAGVGRFGLRYRILDTDGKVVFTGEREAFDFDREASCDWSWMLRLEGVRLWSLELPHLYRIELELVDACGEIVDTLSERFGVRRIEISRSAGLVLNGERIRPRGANRHQDYPRVGYALSDAAQYRDAKRIKEAGFDYVRLSHYPQSPAFLDACDELGILVMNCIPGWQFIGGDAFREACYRNARELIRRDRNHPSVILWELSLNETEMDEVFMDTMMRIGHEEYPGDQMYVCGWMDRFDVFIHSRQHGKIHSWENGDKALVVAEYGDWEFYASNEGFDQKTGAGLLADWSNSRAFRGAGERRLRQQARNHIIALSDTMSSPAVCDGLWSMYDYPRGYHPTRAACGVMDIHRLPKYSYFFYKSQRRPDEGGANWSGGAMVYVASRWTSNSYLDVMVFSNCERVELRLNGALIGDALPSRTSVSQHLAFPPFVFEIEQFNPGRLDAVGFIGGEAVATHWVATAGEPVSIMLSVDDDGVDGAVEEGDVLIAHARIMDGNGVLCKRSSLEICFETEGEVELVGPAVVAAESGVASVVLRRRPGCERFSLGATCVELGDDRCLYELKPCEPATNDFRASEEAVEA